MDIRRFRLPLALCAALAAAGVHAQAGNKARSDAAVLPVWNQASGKLEAVLLLEPTAVPAAGGRWKFGNNTLDAALGLDKGDSLGLVCDRKSGVSSAIGSLVDNCLLTAFDAPGRQNTAGAALSRPGGRVGVNVAAVRDALPGWLTPGNKANRVDQNSLTVYGQKNIGREATVSIGGTWARARLIPASDMPTSVTDRWNSRSVTLGAGLGSFGANVVGRVVDTPQRSGRFEGIDFGLTWRTPWSGQLSVGAENVVTRGRNPFLPGSEDRDEGTVPYVRYEQDL